MQHNSAPETIDIATNGYQLHDQQILFEQTQPLHNLDLSIYIPQSVLPAAQDTAYCIKNMEPEDTIVYQVSKPSFEIQFIHYNTTEEQITDKLFSTIKERLFPREEWVQEIAVTKLEKSLYSGFKASFRLLDEVKNMFLYTIFLNLDKSIVQLNFICENYLSDDYKILFDEMISTLMIGGGPIG